MLLDSSSSDSSDEDDMDLLLLEVAFAERRQLGNKLNLADISDVDCEQMFRCVPCLVKVTYFSSYELIYSN